MAFNRARDFLVKRRDLNVQPIRTRGGEWAVVMLLGGPYATYDLAAEQAGKDAHMLRLLVKEAELDRARERWDYNGERAS
jgi:hypothetical protein